MMRDQISHDVLIQTLNTWEGPQDFIIRNYHFWIYLLLAALFFVVAMIIHPYFILLSFDFAIFAFTQRQSSQPYLCCIRILEDFILTKKYSSQFQDHPDSSTLPNLFNFPLFHLGNYDNEIIDSSYGTWSINGMNLPFMLINYHYVNRINKKDSEGKTKVDYEHHDLWGIQMHQLPIQGISISCFQKRVSRLAVKWESSDIRFNRRYQLSGMNEMELASFFSPTHILKLDEVLHAYPGDLYIHPEIPSLVWLFEQDLLNHSPNSSNIETIQDLSLHLQQLNMPEFEKFQTHAKGLFEEILHD